ncbi:MAG: tRNA uridine-5-carboxymethylaminomethyl(34) synthesis enzyme MnmG, partial [Gammaproteobacteria bacterium]|nr:tRNA uridine-5-carboxymethylaminomethyl(34) synthesis enzyme MnmG [Gammaproteobacteria bacterium]
VVEQSLKDVWVRPDSKGIENLTPILSKPISHEYNLRDLLKRPEVKIEHLTEFMPENYSAKVLEQAEIKTKYEGYLIRQQEEIDKAKHNEETSLPEGMDFSLVRGLSNEACQKLQEFKPLTIGQAGRISGITPATISLLLVHLKRTGS